jgi:lipopolysaccharide biosynthesis protein
MNAGVCSIFFHNYYGQHEKWIQFFSEKMTVPFNLFYNIVEDSIYNIEDDHQFLNDLRENIPGQSLKKLIIRKSPNQGKDIGGKLVLLDTYLHTKQVSEFIVFLHDKKSPYKIQNQEWEKKLFRIINPAFIKPALAFFDANPKTGIIACEESIQNEYDHSRQSFISNNQIQLIQLRSEFDINNTDYRFVAGTMFWVRALPLLTFFTRHTPLDIRRSLEPGNVMDESSGTITHAWERMLSWLIIEQGYKLKGL